MSSLAQPMARMSRPAAPARRQMVVTNVFSLQNAVGRLVRPERPVQSKKATTTEQQQQLNIATNSIDEEAGDGSCVPIAMQSSWALQLEQLRAQARQAAGVVRHAVHAKPSSRVVASDSDEYEGDGMAGAVIRH